MEATLWIVLLSRVHTTLPIQVHAKEPGTRHTCCTSYRKLGPSPVLRPHPVLVIVFAANRDNGGALESGCSMLRQPPQGPQPTPNCGDPYMGLGRLPGLM
jgi:hypothetical protein